MCYLKERIINHEIYNFHNTLLETIRTLFRRSLIENSSSKFTQKPVIVKLVREKFFEKTGRNTIN